MSLSLKIAYRYLFSKKSHNAINLISMVSVCGIMVATIAMVCALSVFNGFSGLVSDMFSTFDPQLKVTAAHGRTFDFEDSRIQALASRPDIAVIVQSLQYQALVRYQDKQAPANVKGVSDNFGELTQIDSILIDGQFILQDEMNDYATLGLGLARNLGINAGFIYPVEIYAPKREGKVNMANPSSAFNQEYAYIGGVFSMDQPVYDNHYLLVPLSLARSLFDYTSEVTAVEIRLKDGVSLSRAQREIQALLGDDFQVKNRYQQQEDSFKMMNIEKWMTFLILAFIMTIAIFNVVGSLSMLIIEKKDDIQTLRNLGADNTLISRIFLLEGWLISMLGGVVGIVIGLILCLAQQHFGLLRMGDEAGIFVVDAYPVRVEFGDILFVFLTVSLVGFLATLYPVRKLKVKN